MLKAYKSEKRKREQTRKLEREREMREGELKRTIEKKLQGIADAHTYTIEFSIS